jgi:hypothetical protein
MKSILQLLKPHFKTKDGEIIYEGSIMCEKSGGNVEFIVSKIDEQNGKASYIDTKGCFGDAGREWPAEAFALFNEHYKLKK